MTHSDLYNLDEIHPLDIVESVAAHHDWSFDRLCEDQISMDIEGQWRGYTLTLAWSDRDEALRLVCTFEMEPPHDRMPALYEMLNLVNDQVWEGSFAYWPDQQVMSWRYGLLLCGEGVASPDQVDQMIRAAVTACERFYPAFQMVTWGDAKPAEAIKVAMAEAYGSA